MKGFWAMYIFIGTLYWGATLLALPQNTSVPVLERTILLPVSIVMWPLIFVADLTEYSSTVIRAKNIEAANAPPQDNGE